MSTNTFGTVYWMPDIEILLTELKEYCDDFIKNHDWYERCCFAFNRYGKTCIMSEKEHDAFSETLAYDEESWDYRFDQRKVESKIDYIISTENDAPLYELYTGIMKDAGSNNQSPVLVVDWIDEEIEAKISKHFYALNSIDENFDELKEIFWNDHPNGHSSLVREIWEKLLKHYSKSKIIELLPDTE